MRLIESRGTLTFLRANNVGDRYGGRGDQIEAEVITKVSSQPDRAMGFMLRDDHNRPARQGMFDLLRDAFNNGWRVILDYRIDLDNGKTNGELIRVGLIKD
jgi:hypothetical protein